MRLWLHQGLCADLVMRGGDNLELNRSSSGHGGDGGVGIMVRGCVWGDSFHTQSTTHMERDPSLSCNTKPGFIFTQAALPCQPSLPRSVWVGLPHPTLRA